MTSSIPTSQSNTPLWRLAWRRFQQHALQYLLFVIGVALGVAMMVSIDLANGSAQRAFVLSTDAITGQATHRISAISPQGVPQDVFKHLKRDLGIEKAAPIIDGYAIAPTLENQPMHLVGVDLFSEAPFRNYFQTDTSNKKEDSSSDNGEGFAQFITEPNAAVLDRTLAESSNIHLGDTIPLDFNGITKSVHVVGLLDPSNRSSQKALSNLIFTDIASAQELFETDSYVSHIDLILDNDGDVQQIANDLPPGIEIQPAEAEKNAVKQMTAAFELNLQALSLLALVVGMFLIYNTVTFSVVQRRSLFGVLRCLGVTPGQLFQTIMGEAAILSIIGSTIGVGLGIVLGKAVVGLITQTINDFYFVVSVQQITLSTFSLFKGFMIGIVASLLAAAVPAWEAMNTSPNTSLRRSTLESRITELQPYLLAGSIGAILMGIAFLRFESGGLVAAFAGLFSMILAAALMTPPITIAMMKGLSPITSQVFGILGRMAPRDIIRSLSRTSVAIAALMVAVSVIVGVSIMIGSFRGTVIQWLDQTLQAEIFITPPSTTANRVNGKLNPDIISDIKEWPTLSDVVTYNDADVTVTQIGLAKDNAAIAMDHKAKIISAEGDVSHGERTYVWKSEPGVDPWIALDEGKGVIISEALLLKENIKDTPSFIALNTPKGEQSFPVIAVFYDYSSDQGTIILDNDIYVDLWRDDTIASIGAFVSPGQDVDDVVNQLKAHFSGRNDVLIQSNQTLRQVSLDIFDRTFAITQALRLLAIIVAFIGVLSALLSLQLERTRELGILRANGMTARQIWGMTVLETGLMGTIAGLLAMPLGFVLAWILIYVINVRSFGWTLQMAIAPSYFWQAGIVAVTAAILAGLYPAWSMGRMNIAQAIREE